jgi:hypothetical protein
MGLQFSRAVEDTEIWSRHRRRLFFSGSVCCFLLRSFLVRNWCGYANSQPAGEQLPFELLSRSRASQYPSGS